MMFVRLAISPLPFNRSFRGVFKTDFFQQISPLMFKAVRDMPIITVDNQQEVLD